MSCSGDVSPPIDADLAELLLLGRFVFYYMTKPLINVGDRAITIDLKFEGSNVGKLELIPTLDINLELEAYKIEVTWDDHRFIGINLHSQGFLEFVQNRVSKGHFKPIEFQRVTRDIAVINDLGSKSIRTVQEITWRQDV